MSGTDPRAKWFGKQGEPTEHFAPDGSETEQVLPNDLPKIPGITLHHEIARGGMGVVYSGRQDFLDRRVAVKFLSVDLGGAAFAQRFQREAKILAGISHPNIVGCHMADTTPEGQSYLVMEFCDGPPLKSWVAENGPVAPVAAIRLIGASAQALAHAYQSGIIHRDVKPENILLETVTTTCLDINFPFTPKIVDLGLARITHEQIGEGLTSPGSVMGTPATMSPEQFDDPDSVDFRSDIYGLGCCLYEMLVGKPAFAGKKLTDIVVRKRDPSPPNPCDENPAVPAAVGAFTQRLLASNRNDRPASYKDLDREVDQLMEALQSQGKRTDTIVDEGMDQTIPSRPGAFGATSAGQPPGGTQPPVAPVGKTEAAQEKPKQTSPGMLNTGELDFLSAGARAGATTPPPTAFGDSGSSGTAATNPMGESSPGASNKGTYIGVGAVAVLAALLGVVSGMGGSGDERRGGPGDPGRETTNPGNSALTVTPIKLFVGGNEVEDPTVDMGGEFELGVEVAASDGDAIAYDWSWPERALSPLVQTNSSTIKFRLDDGLPGVRHTVQLRVRDGSSAAPVSRQFQVQVGNCPEQMPLIGWDANGIWEKVSGTWRTRMDTANPANQGASGRVVRREQAVLRTQLGTETYWEWSGSLEPTGQADGESSAMVALKFGDKGYAIRCDRVQQDTVWSIKILERVPGGNEWRPPASGRQASWVQPADSDAASRGWFSVRRMSEQLVVQIGEFAQPAPRPGRPLQAPTIVRQPALTIDLTTQECQQLAAGQLELVVTKARCVFRAIKR